MAWNIDVTAPARRQLSRLDPAVAGRIARFFKERVATAENPRSLGKAMQGGLAGSWGYRVGDYRVICRIEDARITIVVIEVGHRSDVYR